MKLLLFNSTIGYYLINKISDVDIPRNTGDFRILSRRVVEELKYLKKAMAFRGLVAFVGFKQHYVDYIKMKDSRDLESIIDLLDH